MDGVASKLLATLRRVAPHKVRAFDGSDEPRDIAVPTRRKRWAQVIETIEAKPWVRVVMLDKSGAELAYVENDGAPMAIEDLSAPEAVAKGSRERWLLELMLKAQDMALRNRDGEFRAIMTGMRDMMSVQTEAMRGVFQLLAIQRDVAADVAAQRTRLETEDQGDMAQVMKMLEAAPEIVGKLAPIIQVMTAKKRPPRPTTAPNGTPPKTEPVS